MRKWFEDKKLLELTKKQVENNFPSLIFSLEGNNAYIRGPLEIINDGKVIDRYFIEIELPDDYPKSIPVLREVGARIPKIADRHINKVDGTACPLLPEERWKYYPVGSNIIDFIKGPCRQFFINQTHFELTGEWVSGEWKHGVDAIYDFYSKELNTKDPLLLEEFLKTLAAKNFKPHWFCVCGSNKKTKHCHTKLVELRKKIPTEIVEKSHSKLAEARKVAYKKFEKEQLEKQGKLNS